MAERKETRLGYLRTLLDKMKALHEAFGAADTAARARNVLQLLQQDPQGLSDDGFAKALHTLRTAPGEGSHMSLPDLVRDMDARRKRFLDYAAGLRRTIRPRGYTTFISALKENVDRLTKHAGKPLSAQANEAVRKSMGEYVRTKLTALRGDARQWAQATPDGSPAVSELAAALDGVLNSDGLREAIAEAARTYSTNLNRSSYNKVPESSETGSIFDRDGSLMQKMQNAVQEVTEQEQNNNADPLIAKLPKVTEQATDLYLELCASSDKLRTERPDAVFPHVEELKESLSLKHMYGLMLGPLLAVSDAALKDVDQQLRRTPDAAKKDKLVGILTALSALPADLTAAQQGGKPTFDAHTKFLSAYKGYDEVRSGPLGDPVTVRYGSKAAALAGASASSSASGSRPGAGRGSDRDGDGDNPSAPGFMYRVPDQDRLDAYNDEAERFGATIADNMTAGNRMTKQAARLANRAADLNALVKDAGGDEAAVRDATAAKAASAQTFADGAHNTVRDYVQLHADFALKKHRAAIAYVRYWDGMRPAISRDFPKAVEAVDKHRKLMRDTVATALAALRKLRADVMQALGSDDLTKKMSDAQVQALQERVEELDAYLGACMERVERFYLRSPASNLLEAVTQPQFLIMYALKAVRFVLAYAALRWAANVFQGMYARAAYGAGGSGDPPHPIQLVGIALATDLALNAVVVSLLLLMRYLFKTTENSFPVDHDLLVAYAVDLAATQLVVGCFATIIAAVIYNKKYFRYRYEGDRGIRAMREMLVSIYALVLPLPFFRLAQ